MLFLSNNFNDMEWQQNEIVDFSNSNWDVQRIDLMSTSTSSGGGGTSGGCGSGSGDGGDGSCKGDGSTGGTTSA